MKSQIFLNIRTDDLVKTKEFFSALGFTFDPNFTNDEAACLIIAENIYSMIHTDKSFKRFTDKELCNSRTTTEALFALSCSSREEVDQIVNKSVEAGGKAHKEKQDHGFMYAHGFEDLDGHIWEVLYIDEQQEK